MLAVRTAPRGPSSFYPSQLNSITSVTLRLISSQICSVRRCRSQQTIETKFPDTSQVPRRFQLGCGGGFRRQQPRGGKVAIAVRHS
eukprot:2602933-Rhodomonas_salina.1